MQTAFSLLKSFRLRQWIKNGFVFLPLLFAKKVFYYPSLLEAFAAAGIFCLLASGTYLINDLFDLNEDRKHPTKRHRPLAAGLISPQLAGGVAVFFILCSLTGAILLGVEFFIILAIYTTLQLIYNLRLKQVVILDIFSVSAGFFLRVVAGAVAIKVTISHWLIICTVLLAMFLTIAKRRHELVYLKEEDAKNHRSVLSQYSPYFLDQMMGVVTAATLLSYMLYCISAETIEKFQTDQLIYTFPFVLYGIFRYLYLIHKKHQGGEPDKIFLSDRPLLFSVILWALFCMLIVYGVI